MKFSEAVKFRPEDNEIFIKGLLKDLSKIDFNKHKKKIITLSKNGKGNPEEIKDAITNLISEVKQLDEWL